MDIAGIRSRLQLHRRRLCHSRYAHGAERYYTDRKKDYIENPKDNGYRSLHLVLSVPVFLLNGCESVPVEVQIRTVAMDFWASLEHQLRYKKGKELTTKINFELKACAEVSAKLDKRMQGLFDEINTME